MKETRNKIIDLSKWRYKKCLTKESALDEINKLGIIGSEIENIIILDKDELCSDSHYLAITYYNDVLHTKYKDINECRLKLKEFKNDHDIITLEDFPKDFKYMCPTYSNMPLILKMKNGDYIELFHREYFDNNDSSLKWTRELLLSKNELFKYIDQASPIMNYNKLYGFILNQKIVDVNFDTNRYVNLLDNKLDDNDKINQINIEFENGYVMEIIRSTPDEGYFIAIWDNNNQTFDIFSINDFIENYLGNIEDINKVS